MYWKEGGIVCILALVAVQVTAQVNDNSSSLCNECTPGQYLSVTLNADTDCWNVCMEDELEGSGSASSSVEVGNCIDCHNMCSSCYGPASNQCYSCEGYYVTLPQYAVNNSTPLACENGTIRNTSLEVRHCVSNCTSPFMLMSTSGDGSNSTMECACPRGYYPSINGSLCLQCIDNCSVCIDGTQTGCLQCSVAKYNDQCLLECPSGLGNVNGNCEMQVQNDLFPIDRVALFTIIGAIAFVILFIFLWIWCIVIFLLMKQKRKSKYLIATEGGTTISESFKKVKRNFSIKQRPSRPVSTIAVNHEQDQQRRDIVSSEYDPYLKLHPAAVTIDESKNETLELRGNHQYNQNVTHDNDDDEEEEEEQFYTDMTLSMTNLHDGGLTTPTHKPLGLTKSYEPPQKSDPMRSEERHRLSLPPQSPSHNIEDDQDIYVNPQIDEASDEDTASQENYTEMELGAEVYEQDEYMTSAEVNNQFEDEEQELYTEMNVSTGPAIPKRAVVPPPSSSRSNNVNNTRKETLDNQYVTVQGRDAKLKAYLSDEKLGQAPKYVNVQRPGDPRLRSVTSPLQSSGMPPPEEDESFYGNVP